MEAGDENEYMEKYLEKQRQEEIQDLAEQRADYLKQKVEEDGGATNSLDHKIYRAVREQAETKGLSYEASALAY